MEEILYNKIYARANADGIVIHIFSEVFEEPLETDICIDATNTERHGAQKYKSVDENGIYNYEIVNGMFQERDKSADLQEIESERLNAQYIPNIESSITAFAKIYLKSNPIKDSEQILSIAGLYDQWAPGIYAVGDIKNNAGQTWECWTAHDNSIYPDIKPSNPQTWANFWRPLHGDSVESARPWVKPWAGTTDMYHADEYMVYTDEKVYKCLADTTYSPEEYPAHWEVQE